MNFTTNKRLFTYHMAICTSPELSCISLELSFTSLLWLLEMRSCKPSVRL